MRDVSFITWPQEFPSVWITAWDKELVRLCQVQETDDLPSFLRVAFGSVNVAEHWSTFGGDYGGVPSTLTFSYQA